MAVISTCEAYSAQNIPLLNLGDGVNNIIRSQAVNFEGHAIQQEFREEINKLVRLARLHPCQKRHDNAFEVLPQVRSVPKISLLHALFALVSLTGGQT